MDGGLSTWLFLAPNRSRIALMSLVIDIEIATSKIYEHASYPHVIKIDKPIIGQSKSTMRLGNSLTKAKIPSSYQAQPSTADHMHSASADEMRAPIRPVPANMAADGPISPSAPITRANWCVT